MSASREAYRLSCDVSEREEVELEPSSGLPTPDARLEDEDSGGTLTPLALLTLRSPGGTGGSHISHTPHTKENTSEVSHSHIS